jgi:hypothetical protein
MYFLLPTLDLMGLCVYWQKEGVFQASCGFTLSTAGQQLQHGQCRHSSRVVQWKATSTSHVALGSCGRFVKMSLLPDPANCHENIRSLLRVVFCYYVISHRRKSLLQGSCGSGRPGVFFQLLLHLHMAGVDIANPRSANGWTLEVSPAN